MVNSSVTIQLSLAILSLVLLIAAARWLKHRGKLEKAHIPILVGIVTDFVLPLMIFRSLATGRFGWTGFELPLVMASAELICLGTVYLICRLMRLNSRLAGSIMLTGAFGSSSLLGYTLVAETLGGEKSAVLDAVLISELGVGLPLFTIGVAVAIKMGGQSTDWTLAVRDFLRSPIFLSVLAGTAWSVAGIGNESPPVRFLLDFCRMAGGALPVLVGLTLGLMLKPIPFRQMMQPIAVVVTVKLLLQPLLALSGAHMCGLNTEAMVVLVLLGAMPPAILGAVFAGRYGCDEGVASVLVVAGTVAGLLTIPGLVALIH